MSTTVKKLSVVEIQARFEQPPRLSNPPTYEELELFLRLLQRNAAKIFSHRGGGLHGHLGAIMSPADYLAISGGQAWTPAVHPGTLTIPVGTNALGQANARATHELECNAFFLEQNVLTAIKNQIIEAVPHEFLDEIHHNVSDLQNLSVPQIFSHLFQQPSAIITLEDVEQRREQVETQKYSLEEEPTVYFKRLQDLQTYAKRGGDPITDTNLIAMALRHFRQTGHFNRACNDWNDKVRTTPAHRTWTNFKQHFTEACTRAKQDAASSANAAFQAANQVILQQNNDFQRMQAENLRSIQDLHSQINLMVQQQQKPAPPPPPPYCPPTYDHQAYHMQYPSPYYPPVPPHMYAAQHGANKASPITMDPVLANPKPSAPTPTTTIAGPTATTSTTHTQALLASTQAQDTNLPPPRPTP